MKTQTNGDGTVQFDAVSALLCGIGTFVLALVLQSTNVFSMVPNLPSIGLFLGIIIGGLKDRIPILK